MPVHLFIPGLRRSGAVLLLAPLAAFTGCRDLPEGLYAEISTPKGTMTCELEFTRAPLTVANFVGLAEGSLGPAPRKPFFDGLTFHRVVPHFVIQGGDPLGMGEGGPGYTFPDEFVPGLGHDSAGILSMANDGPDTNGSQFFITLAPAERLNFLHSVFGRTVRGSDVLAKIAQGDAMRVRILRLGRAARAFRADEAAFSALSAKAPRFTAEREPGPRAHFDDHDRLLPSDPPRAQNFNFKLCNVERATGLRIYARAFARFVPAEPGESPDAFAGALSRSLGLADDGVLAVYFADQDKWFLKVGNSMVRRFNGAAGDTRDIAGNEPFAAVMNGFLLRYREREARYAAQSAAILPKNLQTGAQEIKISVDAFLDELLWKLSS